MNGVQIQVNRHVHTQSIKNNFNKKEIMSVYQNQGKTSKNLLLMIQMTLEGMFQKLSMEHPSTYPENQVLHLRENIDNLSV